MDGATARSEVETAPSEALFVKREGVYGMIYGMKKTTVYLPDDLKAALERAAATEGCSEAELIRSAVREKVQALTPPRPRLPLWPEGFGDATVAERVDELLQGFGGS